MAMPFSPLGLGIDELGNLRGQRLV